MQPVNNNSNASAANANNNNNNAAAVKSVNASNNSNKDGNNTKVQSNGNAYKVSLTKGGRKRSKKSRMLAAQQANDTKRNERKGRKSRSDAAEKAGRTEKSRRSHGRNSADKQIRVKLTDNKEHRVRNLFDKFTEKNAQTIKATGGKKTEKDSPAVATDKNIKPDQVSGTPDKKAPAASNQIVITAPKGPALGSKAEGNGKVFNIPNLKKDDGDTEDSKEDKKVGNIPDLFKEKENNGNGQILGIGNNGKSNEPPGLLKKDDDDKDKGPVAIRKLKSKNKGPVGVEKKDDKADKVNGKPDTEKEIKGALSKMWDLIEELREKKSSTSKEDSADEQKNYGFGAGMVSLNTSKSFQTSSKPTYARPVGAAKGSAIHINGGSDSKSDRSDTTIVNNGSLSLGPLTNRAGALSTYSQIQDLG